MMKMIKPGDNSLGFIDFVLGKMYYLLKESKKHLIKAQK